MMSLINHPFIDRPIPDLSKLRSEKSSYRTHSIVELVERCVKVNGLFRCESFYFHYDPRPDGAIKEIFLRESLTVKLDNMNSVLSPLGLQLMIQEGYRPLIVQRFVQEVSVLKGLKKENPNLTDDELREMVKMFAASANGDLQNSPPPHMTGGAVDLTLIYSGTGKQVDMGKSGGLFNTAFPDALENGEPKSEEARKFRRLLYWLAIERGLVVNPTEWWHLSYGDQMWAWINRKSHAHYGIATDLLPTSGGLIQ